MLWNLVFISLETSFRFMMQFQQCRKKEMRSSITLQHFDVTSCKQRNLTTKHNWCKGVSTCSNCRKFWKVSSINEGVIAFSKKVHVFFLRDRVLLLFYLPSTEEPRKLGRALAFWVNDPAWGKLMNHVWKAVKSRHQSTIYGTYTIEQNI